MPGPDVYVEEGRYGPRPIAGAEIVTAFVGLGAVAGPARVAGVPEFEGAFGGLPDALATAVGLFFANGGDVAWAVRAATLADGLAALDAAPQVDVLALPGIDDPAAQATALHWAEARGAFLILDLPPAVRTAVDAQAWLASATALRRPNAAAWFPRIVVGGEACAASGAIAGMLARTMMERGIWKAPSGAGAGLSGATGVASAIAQADADALSRQGVNQIRRLPGGLVAWSARTLAGDAAGEWKYVNVRRLALYLQRSIDQGLKWAVFEPNGEALWSAVRASIETFLMDVWRNGALQGSKLSQAAYVRCDRTTMSQDDIDNGRLVVEIGFAPVKPAEFVIFRIGQGTADGKP